jgi:hypothetical protein
VLLDFLGSQEYRQTFPDNLMASVEEWARGEAAVALAPRGGAKPLTAWPVDMDIRFSEDDPKIDALLGPLWHRRDAQGRWSDGRTGDLRFLLPEDAAEHGATLSLRLRVAGTKHTGPRTVVAHCNRRELATITLADDAPQIWTLGLPSSLYAREGINLLLVADQDYSPATSGESADRRALGVMLIEGRLTVEPSAV